MPIHDRHRLSLSASRLRHRRHQRAVLAGRQARRAAGAGRPSRHRRLSRPARGDRGGGAEAQPAPALDDRLRGRAGRGADPQAHQRALGDGRPRDGAARRPRARTAAQRFRGAGLDAAGHSAGLVAPHRPARLRQPRPAGHSRAWNGPRRRRADRNRRPSHPSLVGRRSHRLRPGLARGVRALAASGARPAEGWTARS